MIHDAYRRTDLSNGISIVSELIPHVRSVSLGVWIRTGARCELPHNSGVAHFLEHMVFKQTETRSTRDIVRTIESVGGNINAFTSKEQTCYFVEVLDEDLPMAIDVLADILSREGFDADDLEKERQVILDEIQSMEDAPDEMVQEDFVERLFPNHSLGTPIIGTPQTVADMTTDTLMAYYRSNYHASNILISAAGNVEHETLLALCQNRFHFAAGGKPAHFTSPAVVGHGTYEFSKPINQAHICVGVPGISYADERRYQMLVLNTILGGGMGARLFQNIREAYGIAYGIYSFYDVYSDSGLFGVYLGTDKQNKDLAVNLIDKELSKLRKEPVGSDELAEAKSQLKGSMLLSLESTARRMNRLAMTTIYLGDMFALDVIIQRINRVTASSILEMAQELLAEEKILRVIYSPGN